MEPRYLAALGTKGDLHGICEALHTGKNLRAAICTKLQLLGGVVA